MPYDVVIGHKSLCNTVVKYNKRKNIIIYCKKIKVYKTVKHCYRPFHVLMETFFDSLWKACHIYTHGHL